MKSIVPFLPSLKVEELLEMVESHVERATNRREDTRGRSRTRLRVFLEASVKLWSRMALIKL